MVRTPVTLVLLSIPHALRNVVVKLLSVCGARASGRLEYSGMSFLCFRILHTGG